MATAQLDRPCHGFFYTPLEFDSYWNFEPVIFQVENTLFRVLKDKFMIEGTPFETMFSMPPEDSDNVEGSRPENPIVLESTSANDFRLFLRVLYPLGAEPVKAYLDWVSVLRLAHKWEFDEIRKRAIEVLHPYVNSLSADVQIDMGKKFFVREWLKLGLTNVAYRVDLTITELEEQPFSFDKDSVIRIFFIQSHAWKRQAKENNFSFIRYVSECLDELFAGELSAATRGEKEVSTAYVNHKIPESN